MSSKPEFVYFNGRGLGESIRIVLTAAGIKFTEVDLKSRHQFLELMPELLFKQTPLLRIDGVSLVQSRAIMRYIGLKNNLLGDTDLEKARVDELFEGSRDFYKNFVSLGFVEDSKALLATIEKDLERYLPIFDKVARETDTGYLVGPSLTIADVGLFEVLEATIDYFGKERFESFSGITRFYETVTSLENIKKYLRDIRKPRNDSAYVKEVNEILTEEGLSASLASV